MTAYLDWKVGDKIVCVDNDWSPATLKAWPGISLPVVGGTYTIREIYREPRAKMKTDDPIFVRLAELINPPHKTFLGPYEAAFHVRHFRRAVERKTDISIFTAMLTSTKVLA